MIILRITGGRLAACGAALARQVNISTACGWFSFQFSKSVVDLSEPMASVKDSSSQLLSSDRFNQATLLKQAVLLVL
jgi:hypothetical protein